MKRSEINLYIREAMEFFEQYQFKLPSWAFYTPEDWKNVCHDSHANEIITCSLGWDVTGFGGDDFHSLGLTLFTLRNGGMGYDKSYAEKIMMVRHRQVTPLHFHWLKQEDIINRGGGNLIIELFHADPIAGLLTGKEFQISVDGMARIMKSGEKLILSPGESVCLKPCHAHRFWGDGTCMIGEVSKVNDDSNDNCFIEGMPRFEKIEDDESPYYLLAADYRKFLPFEESVSQSYP